MIICSMNILSDQQKKDILELQEICFNFENLRNKAYLSNDINFYKEIPCFYMGYEGERLVAFLTTFIPEEQEAEIIAFTHPDYRRRGYFDNLLQEATEVLKSSGIFKILFAIETNSQSGIKTLEKFSPITLERSEYRMSHGRDTAIPSYPDLTFHIIAMENKKICLSIMDEIFCLEGEENEIFIDNAIQSSDRVAYLAYLEETPIGSFSLHYEEEAAFIYGLGILPAYQNAGYGRQVLGYALNISLSNKQKTILDVDSSNPAAYQLYTHNGFTFDFQTDYFTYFLTKPTQGK